MLIKAREMARRYGKVIVAIDSDQRIKSLKGESRPIFTEAERGQALYDLKIFDRNLVDRVEFFYSDGDLIDIIQKIKPDVMLKGSDWKGKKIIGQGFVDIEFFDRLVDYSTTEIIKRVTDGYTRNS
jgi:D-beta-D-heptose 7-phosphate kinase/D-beta-D-heptose 1-phosphate adenosyltransferase